MRGLRLGLAAMVLASVMAPPTHALSPVKEQQLAIANFILPTDKRDVFDWYGGIAWVKDDMVDDSRDLLAGIFRGKCIKKKKQGSADLRCTGRGLSRTRRRDFHMNDLGTRAFFRARGEGFKHRITWIATKPASGGYESEEACRQGQGYGAGVSHDARAKASLFGKSLRSNGSYLAFAITAKGAGVTQCDYDDLATRIARGDTITLTRGFPTR